MLSQVEIKHVNALKIKKYRYKYAQFIAEGDKIIKELIAEGMEVVHIYAQPAKSSLQHPQCKSVTEQEMQKLTALSNPAASLAVFAMPVRDAAPAAGEWIVVLDDIQDPGNMGTIIRTCDWFGVKKIICSDGCVDVYNPKVVQSSMASVGRVSVMETGLAAFFHEYQGPVYGAVFDGVNYHQQAFTAPGCILIGNEGHGIDAELLPFISHPVTIPRKGKAESLNAAIATALILDKLP